MLKKIRIIINWLSFLLLLSPLFLSALADVSASEDCPNSQIAWKTYISPSMQLSFSYPSSWRIFPERGDLIGILLNIKAKNLLVGIQRLNDKNESKTEHEKLFYGQQKHMQSSVEKLIINKNTYTKISFVTDGLKRISMYCPEKKVAITFTFSNYSSGNDSTCSSVIDQMLASFEFTSMAAIPVKNIHLADYDSIQWKIYNSPELNISFSYPTFWKIVPEISEYNAMSLRLTSYEDSSSIGLVIHRWIDPITSRKFDQFLADDTRQNSNQLNYKQKERNVSNNNCIEISYKNHYIRSNTDVSIKTFYCPQKKLRILFYYSSSQEAVYMPIIEKVLSSFIIDEGRIK